MRLTATQERYLRAIYDLNLEEDDAKVSRIAQFVGVTKATASVAVHWLETNGLAMRGQQKQVRLTARGNELAVLSYGKRDILYQFLLETLRVPQSIAASDAEALEPVVSMPTLCAFCREARQCACISCKQGQHDAKGDEPLFADGAV